MEPWYITYDANVGWSGSLDVTVFPGGTSSVYLSWNLGPKQEIGYYEHELSEETCERLRATLRRSEYKKLANDEPVPPGTGLITIGEGVEGSLPETFSFLRAELPEQLRPFIEQMEEVVDTIRQHPVHVLAGSATWEKKTFDAREPISWRIELRNAGDKSLQLVNPAGPLVGESVRTSLMFSPLAPEQDADAGGDIEVEPSDFQRVTPEGLDTGIRDVAEISLSPDEVLSLRAEKALYIPPGKYSAYMWLSLSSTDESSLEKVEGTLEIEMDTLEVTS